MSLLLQLAQPERSDDDIDDDDDDNDDVTQSFSTARVCQSPLCYILPCTLTY